MMRLKYSTLSKFMYLVISPQLVASVFDHCPTFNQITCRAVVGHPSTDLEYLSACHSLDARMSMCLCVSRSTDECVHCILVMVE